MTQAEALDILKLGHNVYLTGSAGSGKTYVLNEYINYLRKNGAAPAVTASTGIAATHLGGMTIHAWSGLGIKARLTDEDIDALEEKSWLWKRIAESKVLIIDEISMFHHFRLDLVERICRAFKRNDMPFGGLQVVLCGDFFQLPPVSRSEEEPARFSYHADSWQKLDLKVCYLHEQFRQQDDALLDILTAIRSGEVEDELLEQLQTRYHADFAEGVQPTRLYTHNIDVDGVNTTELGKLTAETHVYTMETRGRLHLMEALKKSCLAPERLMLKRGAQVMFVKNNLDAGTVSGFAIDGSPLVKLLKGPTLTVAPATWRIEENGKELARLEQLPLRLAWAITVHKSQGMSLDAAEMDLAKAFEPGMGYVALSRVRTLAGVRLLGWHARALQVHPEVLAIDGEFRKASEVAVAELKKIPKQEKVQLQQAFLVQVGKPKKPKKLPPHHQTKEHLPLASLYDIADKRGVTIGTIIEHIEKLQEEGETPDISHLKRSLLTDAQLKKIAAAFEKTASTNPDQRLAPVKNILGSAFTYDQIRFAKLFL